jgi:hypothetical protein
MLTQTGWMLKGAVVLLVGGVGVLLGTAPAGSRPAAGSLKVEVTLATRTAAAMGEVGAKFRVTNVSATTQSFRVMNCDWPASWSTDNPHVVVPGMECGKNFAYTETLAPGKRYEKSGSLMILEGTPAGERSFKVGFTPIGGEETAGKETVWSGELKITVKAGKP